MEKVVNKIVVGKRGELTFEPSFGREKRESYIFDPYIIIMMGIKYIKKLHNKDHKDFSFQVSLMSN